MGGQVPQVYLWDITRQPPVLMRQNRVQQPTNVQLEVQALVNQPAWERVSPWSPGPVSPPCAQGLLVLQVTPPVQTFGNLHITPPVAHPVTHFYQSTPSPVKYPIQFSITAPRVVPQYVQAPMTYLDTAIAPVNVSQGAVEVERRKVFIKDIDFNASQGMIQRLCEYPGELETWKYCIDTKSGKIIATYSSYVAAERAARLIDGEKLGKMRVKARLAKDAEVMKPHSPTSASKSEAKLAKGHGKHDSSQRKIMDSTKSGRSHQQLGSPVHGGAHTPNACPAQAANPVIANGSI